MKKLFLILTLLPMLLLAQQYGEDVSIQKKIFLDNIRSGDEQASFQVDYTINPDIKALPVTADGTKDEITEGQDYIISKGENDKYTFILTDSEGKEHKVETSSMPVTIEDKDGNTYEINEKGEIKPLSKNSDIKLDPSTKDTQSKTAVLSFKATGNTKYALDEYKEVYEKVTEYNQQYKTEGTAITASAKFMLPGASDEIAVYIKENKENKLIPEKVRFVTGKGKEYPSAYDSNINGWTLTIVGGQANDGLELYAVEETGKDKYETLGKLNIFTYEPISRSVTLVPVNRQMNGLDKQTVQDGLNEIYKKVGINWTVNVLEKPFDYTPKNGSTFNVTGSGLLSTFTDDMTAINEAFKQSGEYQEDGLYLFVIPNQPSDKGEVSGTGGDMPLGSRFGYLFPDATVRTIAHEVGHEAFSLEHPFDRPGRNSFTKGDLKDNLMDYTSGTDLAKLQWDQTRAPGHVIGLFQTDKSGMISQTETKTVYISQTVSDALKAKGYIYDPTGKIFTLSNGYRISELCYQDNSGKNAAKIGSVIVLSDQDNRYISYKNNDGVFQFYAIQDKQSQKAPISYVSAKSIPDNAVRIVIDSCKIYIDGVAYELGDTGHFCYTFKSPYAIKFWEKFDGIDSHEVMKQVGIIARYMDTMDQEYLKELIEKLKYENSSAADDPMSWDYYFKPLFRSYAKGQEPNAEHLKGTYDRVLAYNKACTDLARRANASEADKFTTADQIVELVKDISFGEKVVVAETPFSKLTNNQRKYLLQILSAGNISGRNNIGESYKAEDIILQIFRTATNKDIATLIKDLDKSVIFSLLSETDDNLYFMQGQFTELVLRLSIALMEQDRLFEDPKAIADLLFNEGNYLVFDNGYFGKKNTEIFSEANEKICLKVGKEIWRELLNSISPAGEQVVNSLVQGKDYSDKCYDPLEYIAIIPVRDIDYGYIKLTKGEMTVVPTMLGYLIFKSETVANAQTTAIIAANTALCMVGASGLSAAISSGSTLSAVATGVDITLGIGAGIVNTVPEIAQDHPEFTKYYNYATIVYTLNRLGYASYQNVKAKWPSGINSAKYARINDWIKNISNTVSRTNIENILNKWSDDLLKALDDIPTRNPNFLNQVEANPSILNYFEEGSKIISNKAPNLKAVELDMYALDKARPINNAIIEPGTSAYKINTTRRNLSQMDINSQSGKIRDANGNILSTDNINGEGLMYVIDDTDNIFIGGRGGQMSYSHPTLIGGTNPNVKCAGMIKFKDGRILEINLQSGHYKPVETALKEAENIFKQKLPANSFDRDFKINYDL